MRWVGARLSGSHFRYGDCVRMWLMHTWIGSLCEAGS